MKKSTLKIIKYPNNFLRRKTREVKIDELKEPKIQRLIFDMVKTMEVENGVGLAAPQVGSDFRICTIKIGDEVFVLINPKIKSFSRRKEVFEEGCLSFPGKFFLVERPVKVKAVAQNIEGKKIKIKADGLLARVLQHEIDHLDGILVIDRAKKNRDRDNLRIMANRGTKIVFFGTPEFAAGILRSLIENDFNVAAVVTQPDKKVGRKQKIAFSPVKKIAIEKGIKVFQPRSLRESEAIREIGKIGSDLFVVAAYGKILPQKILEIPRFGAINIHASLLPKYRGVSPVQCAILEGEKETGITLMLMNEKMDEGDVLAQAKVAIRDDETADVLLRRLEQLGARMIVKIIPRWLNEEVRPVPQEEKFATFCKPIRREDGKIDWNLNAEEIYRKWRAFYPWPGIFSLYKVRSRSKRLKLLEIEVISGFESGEKPGKVIKYNQQIAVQTRKGLVVLKKIQLEGKKEMAIEDFVRGYPAFVGSELN